MSCRGLELAYQRVHGVVGTGVGYTQGEVVQPTYEGAASIVEHTAFR